MGLGITLSLSLPGFSASLQNMIQGAISWPIAGGLTLMMYPPLTQIRYEELPRVFGDFKILV